jgi:hypothetical protein
LTGLNHENIYGQLERGFDVVFNLGAVHDRGFLRAFNQQVNVTALELFIQPRAIKPYLSVATQHSLGCALDGGDLGRGQAHGLVSWFLDDNFKVFAESLFRLIRPSHWLCRPALVADAG